MKRIRITIAALAALTAAAPLYADLQKALAEPNLEKRSKLALDNAMAVYQTLRDDYQKGDNEKVAADVKEIGDSINLAYDSLEKTGKNPRKSPGPFKKAELKTRDLERRLDSFQQDMNSSERPMLDSLKARVRQVHDDLLMGLMEGKKK